MGKNNLKTLAVTFFISGIWDLIAGVIYLFFIGNGRLIDNPQAHSFYCVFIASFFFCFAYIQFFSAFNIRRYLFNVGCLILGRLFYVIQLYWYILFFKDFPSTFWFTGIIDMTFVILYFVFAFRAGIGMKDLFLPSRENR